MKSIILAIVLTAATLSGAIADTSNNVPANNSYGWHWRHPGWHHWHHGWWHWHHRGWR